MLLCISKLCKEVHNFSDNMHILAILSRHSSEWKKSYKIVPWNTRQWQTHLKHTNSSLHVLHCHSRNLNKAIASIGIPAHFDIIILCYCFNTKEFCEINNENNNLFFYQILMNVQVTMADVHSHVSTHQGLLNVLVHQGTS